MTNTNDCIAKNGIVDHADDHKIFIRILSVSACASCHAKGMCTSSESSEKLIEVDREGAPDLMPGQQVQVSMSTANGNLAVVFGYFLPFVVLILALVILLNFLPEGVAGLVSIALLIPYYTGLYLFRDKLRQRLKFTVEKQTNTNL